MVKEPTELQPTKDFLKSCYMRYKDESNIFDYKKNKELRLVMNPGSDLYDFKIVLENRDIYNKMYNSIVLASSLFGSVYLFSTSLLSINTSLLENKKMSNNFILINGLILAISGSIIVATWFSLLNLSPLSV